MVLDRRRTLQLAGSVAATALTGCATSLGETDEQTREYNLVVHRIDESPVDDALYAPTGLFEASTRDALAAILPEGRHTTYGYQALPADAYVEHEGRYYQTKYVVTGRERMERTLVGGGSVPDEEVPEDAVALETLPRPVERVVKILHVHAAIRGEDGASDLLRDGEYVLRRPEETESALATGDLADRVVRLGDAGEGGLRVRTTREPILEPAHTALAVEIASARPRFREVVFADRVDAELAPRDLSRGGRSILDDAIGKERYRETVPLSDAYSALLSALGLADVEEFANDRRLWYDGEYYRYALYVTKPSR